MPWDCEQTIQGNIRTILPCPFNARILAVEITADNQRLTWYRSGFFRALINIDGTQFVGVDIETKFGQQIIEVPFVDYQIEFTPRVWLNSTTIKIKQLSTAQSITIMGINNAPATPEVLGTEVVTIINASITSITIDPANAARRQGFVTNKSNRNFWVNFSATAATAAAPTNLVTPGSNIEIPENYTGPITGIWSGPTPTLNCEVHQFSVV
jgi:hypothetical protein